MDKELLARLVFVLEKLPAAFQNRDSAAKTGEHLSKLERNVTAAQNQKEENNPTETINASAEQKLSFRNPTMMGGSSSSNLLSLFRRFYINQDIQSMLSFTSNESKSRFGERRILEFYKSTNLLGPDIKLKSIKYSVDSMHCTLNYEVIMFATKNIRTINCSIENDTAKISLCNLKSIFCN